MKKQNISRREFVTASSAALAGSVLAKPASVLAAPKEKLRIAIVGTGIRGTTMWGKSVNDVYKNEVEIVGLCDVNPGRVNFAKKYIGANCPTFADFDKMVKETKPHKIVVTTPDYTHNQYIIRAMELGCDVITEKPLTTDETKCQAIIDAQEKTGKDIIVTFNYRYSPHRQALKDVLMDGRIGKLTSVDFHWYLDVYHGADYFRRWHGRERFGGTLFVHKACHHFDLLNWWIDSDPAEVFAFANQEYYGANGPFRSGKCRGCPHKHDCKHFWDITKDDYLTNLYVKNEEHDGYIRDGCVFSKENDVYDKMAASIKYANGVQVSYSCTTYSPYEGYRIAFNGTKGRFEAWVKERQPWIEGDFDEIRVTDNFGYTQLIQIPHGDGGHGGGDTRLKDKIFKDPNLPDPYKQAAGLRDGAMAILPGIAARNSVKTGKPVKIADLTSLKPEAQKLYKG